MSWLLMSYCQCLQGFLFTGDFITNKCVLWFILMLTPCPIFPKTYTLA